MKATLLPVSEKDEIFIWVPTPAIGTIKAPVHNQQVVSFANAFDMAGGFSLIAAGHFRQRLLRRVNYNLARVAEMRGRCFVVEIVGQPINKNPRRIAELVVLHNLLTKSVLVLFLLHLFAR